MPSPRRQPQRKIVTRTTPPSIPELSVTYVDLDVILEWPGNPKEHDVGAIAASIERFGFRDPISVNRRTSEIEEGHGRLKTLRAFRDRGAPIPSFVRQHEGRWQVPVLWFDDDEQTQRAYALAHNRTQELGGGYDDERLLQALESAQREGTLTGTGFDDDDVDALRAKLSEDEGSGSDLVREQFRILVTCEDEEQQTVLLERFRNEGLDCKAC